MARRPVRQSLLAGVIATACALAAGCQLTNQSDVDLADGPTAPSPTASPLPSTTPTPQRRLATLSTDRPQRSIRLGEDVRRLVDQQAFADIVDRGSGRRVAQTPNVDVAVIELDQLGRPAAAAEVLLSSAYPHGVSVPVNENLGTSAVRWRRWNPSAWRQGTTGGRDIVTPAPAGARYDFVSPYPASVFKLMVAFGVLRLVDQGAARLDGKYAYRPQRNLCPDSGGGTKTVRQWLDSMLTVSDNRSTCALIKLLHDRNAVTTLNTTLRDLGLTTLQLRGTTSDGGTWLRETITMTSLDTARLLLLVSGAPGELWRTPSGASVTADVLSPASRAVFLQLLGDQGLNHALSTANWCGRGYPAEGIPQRVPDRWISADGTVSVHGRDYRRDVRPCNAKAEVTFAHKTGLVDSAGADAGIVTSLPGAPERRYIIVVFSNLGSSYGDRRAPAGCQGVCSTSGVPYSERFARLGKGIDTLLTRAPTE